MRTTVALQTLANPPRELLQERSARCAPVMLVAWLDWSTRCAWAPAAGLDVNVLDACSPVGASLRRVSRSVSTLTHIDPGAQPLSETRVAPKSIKQYGHYMTLPAARTDARAGTAAVHAPSRCIAGAWICACRRAPHCAKLIGGYYGAFDACVSRGHGASVAAAGRSQALWQCARKISPAGVAENEEPTHSAYD
jgi:hypothetical protein